MEFQGLGSVPLPAASKFRSGNGPGCGGMPTFPWPCQLVAHTACMAKRGIGDPGFRVLVFRASHVDRCICNYHYYSSFGVSGGLELHVHICMYAFVYTWGHTHTHTKSYTLNP